MVNRPHPAYRVALATWLAVTGAAPAFAQYPASAVVQPLPTADDPGERLAAALRTLSVNSTDLGALVAAGRNTLLLGDANAAAGFFGRADQISPRDRRVKAGLASALVQLERPADALPLFAQAAALGTPDAEIASDRGLAHDLLGDPQAAQRDYRTALAAKPDDDMARRRLALSQGIAGDRSAAVATLDPLIRRRDIAAWRAQTFVLAMTGDAQGANAITRVMLPQQQAALQPFLVRLAALSPGDKARAVHFGEMPGGAVPYRPPQVASAAPTYHPPVAQASDLARSPAQAPSPAYPPPVRTAAAPPASVAAPVSTPPASAEPTTLVAATPAGGAAATAPTSIPVPAAATQTATARPRYRRQMRSAAEIFGLGYPPYEYIPLAGIAQQPHGRRVDMSTGFREPLGHRRRDATQVAQAQLAAPPPTVMPMAAPQSQTAQPRSVQPQVSLPAAAPERAASIVSTTVDGAATSATPAVPPEPAAPSDAPASSATAPSPRPSGLATSVAVAGAEPPPPPPVGTSGGGGHYDLPHAVVARSGPVRAQPARLVEVVRAEPSRPVGTARSAATREEATGDDHAPPARRHGAASTAAARPSRDDAGEPGTSRDAKRTGRRSADDRGARGDAPVSRGEDDQRGTGATRRGTRDGSADEAKRHGAPRDDADEPDAGTARRGRRDADASTRSARSDDDAPAKSRHGSRDGARRGKGAARNGAEDDDKPTSRRGRAAGDESGGKRKGDPARIYVQVAGGANRADLGKALAGVRRHAPELMKGRTASTTPLRATNRLLVGPFKDEDEAQGFVNKAAGKGVSGFVFKSAKGQKIDKIDAE
ncbi:SPOR domain-containing protein [Sphingomonas sp.]|uniref:SPOR domain-containing protein n=1 Tax=Sphingomonas sp. TaxID=28214 RepID=UPI003AFFBEFA